MLCSWIMMDLSFSKMSINDEDHPTECPFLKFVNPIIQCPTTKHPNQWAIGKLGVKKRFY